MKTTVISAYPCCGKTFCSERLGKQYIILDSDSSKFSWTIRKPTEEEIEEYGEQHKNTLHGEDYFKKLYADTNIKVRDPQFPENYIQYIKNNLGKVDVIFVSSHLEVRKALQDAGIEYVTVYPDPDLIEEWVGRMYLRNSSESFIKFQIDHWEEFTKGIEKEPHGKCVYRLQARQYLANVLEDIVAKYRNNKSGVRDVIVPDPRKE